MTDYTISSKDLTDAESFLVQFQTEMVPEANLEKGGAVRDLLIKGFAGMYAYLRGEIDRVEARQSLLRMQVLLYMTAGAAQRIIPIITAFLTESPPTGSKTLKEIISPSSVTVVRLYCAFMLIGMENINTVPIRNIDKKIQTKTILFLSMFLLRFSPLLILIFQF